MKAKNALVMGKFDDNNDAMDETDTIVVDFADPGFTHQVHIITVWKCHDFSIT